MSRTPKKTDALEMRLSPEEKAKLKQRAAEEGLTVSALIRSRLGDVLGDSPPSSATREQGSVLMREITKRLSSRPGLAALAGAAAFTALAIAAPSSAQSVRMDVAAEIVRVDESGGRDAFSSSSSAITLGFGQPFDIDLGAAESAERYHIRLIAQPIDAAQAMISSEITRLDGEARTQLGAPGVLVRYGEEARLQLNAPDAPEISLRVLVAQPS